MSAYKPGLWKAILEIGEVWEEETAELVVHIPEIVECVLGDEEVLAARRLANLRLIAAAPSLVEAIRTALADISAHKSEADLFRVMSDLAAAIEVALGPDDDP